MAGLLGSMDNLRGILASPSTNDFALALLANSGYSPRRRGLGEIIGQSMLQSRQMAAEQAQQKLREQYMRAQIEAMQQKPQAQEELAIVIGEDGKPVYVPRSQAIGKSPYERQTGPASDPTSIAEFKLSQQDPSFAKWLREREAMGRAPPAPPSYAPQFDLEPITRPDGTVGLGRFNQRTGQLEDTGMSPAPEKPPKETAPTEGERTSANYFDRMNAAEQYIGNTAPSSRDYLAAMNMIKGGAVRGMIGNSMLSNQGQQYYQGAMDWVRAKLRKESGAVIGEEEMAAEIKTYFPIPGDSPQTIEQKRVARLQAAEGMRSMAGRAAVAPRAFANEAQAAAAAVRGEIKPGDEITVGGRKARWQ